MYCIIIEKFKMFYGGIEERITVFGVGIGIIIEKDLSSCEERIFF